MKEKVLVMGGSYFIGKKVVEVLLENNYDVYTLNRGSRKVEDKRIKNIICDRDNEESLITTLFSFTFDYVVDISGLNKDQVEKLLNALNLDKLKKYIFLSSSAVYDIENLHYPFKENMNLKENKIWTFYGKDKIEAEEYLKNNLINTNLTILRPPYVYGEDNYAQRESFIFDHLVNDKTIILPQNGERKLQFIYSKDLAEIINKLLKETKDKIDIYNVGNKDAITIKEWIYACAKVVNKEPKILEYDYKNDNISERDFFPFFDYDNVLDVSKINTIYSKETDFQEGLLNAYKWYLDNKDNIIFKANVIENEKMILDRNK